MVYTFFTTGFPSEIARRLSPLFSEKPFGTAQHQDMVVFGPEIKKSWCFKKISSGKKQGSGFAVSVPCSACIPARDL